MSLKYHSGDEIRKGDRVLFHGDPAEVEFIADPLVRDSETDWYVKKYGGGVMVFEAEAKRFGRTFLSDTSSEEDLVLVSRAVQASLGC